MQPGWLFHSQSHLSLILALSTLVAEIRIASLSTILGGEPERLMLVPLIVLAIVFVAQAVLRHRQLAARTSIGAT